MINAAIGQENASCFLDGGRLEVAAPVFSIELPHGAALAVSSPLASAKYSTRDAGIDGGNVDASHNSSSDLANGSRFALIGGGAYFAAEFISVHGDNNVK